MAEDRDDLQRTEEPTQKRLDEARRKGDVVKSQELAAFILLSGGTLALLFASQSAVAIFLSEFVVFLQSPESFALDAVSIEQIFAHSLYGLFGVIGPICGLMMVVALAAHMLQTPLIFSTTRITPEFSKISPMAAVPQATVVITNPTHYAVALKYETGKTGAPICVAKGIDLLALKIREIAAEHDVPIIENPPLARALYASVDLDEEISADHYKAVAQIIGYVMKLANQRAFWRN